MLILYFEYLADTAAVYRNETHISEALSTLLPKYNLTRKDIFITSKLGKSTQFITVHILGRIFQLMAMCLVYQKDGKVENNDLIDKVTLSTRSSWKPA